jgi:hypothetical protein
MCHLSSPFGEIYLTQDFEMVNRWWKYHGITPCDTGSLSGVTSWAGDQYLIWIKPGQRVANWHGVIAHEACHLADRMAQDCLFFAKGQTSSEVRSYIVQWVVSQFIVSFNRTNKELKCKA